jgi:multimeric flavodoxin WrbA
MKILGISGGFKNGNNDAMCREALMGAKEMGAEVEFIHLLDLDLKPCSGCLACIAGPQGIMRGGRGACTQKDDFPWIDEKYLEADGLLFSMPIYEKGTPGVFEVLRDRMAGPAHDTGLLVVAREMASKAGSVGPDARHFKKRVVSFIGIGGSEWTTHMAADFSLFAISAPMQIIDNQVFPWSKCIVAEDDKIARCREIGRSLAKACADPDNAKYLGEPGICGHCHSRLIYLNDDATNAVCAVCGITGEIVIENGKIKYKFPPEQLQHAHDTMAGKAIHMEDVRNNEINYNALKLTEQFKQRQAAYKAFIEPSTPPSRQRV